MHCPQEQTSSRTPTAAAVDLPEPEDGGPGVGYAVIDSARVVRYATLDPRWHENAFELDTIVGAIT